MRKLVTQYFESKTLFVIFRLFLGFIFIYASSGKITDPLTFARIVENYKILPYSTIHLFAILLPWIELLCGVLLVFGLFVRGSSLLLLGLLTVFTCAVAINVARGIDIACGCKTPWEKLDRISYRKLAEELGFILMTVQVLFHRCSAGACDSMLRKFTERRP